MNNLKPGTKVLIGQEEFTIITEIDKDGDYRVVSESGSEHYRKHTKITKVINQIELKDFVNRKNLYVTERIEHFSHLVTLLPTGLLIQSDPPMFIPLQQGDFL